jgi:hypothetical protein
MANLTQEKSLQIALSLPLPCERELLRLYLWPQSSTDTTLPHSQLPLVETIALDSNTGTIPTHLSSTVSCLDLLPDDPSQRIVSSSQLPSPQPPPPSENRSTPRKLSSSSMGTNPPLPPSNRPINLQYRYALIRSDHVDTSAPPSGYYLVQFRSKDPTLDLSIHPDLMTESQATNSKPHPPNNDSHPVRHQQRRQMVSREYLLFEQIQKGYRDGLVKTTGKQHTPTPSSSGKSSEIELSILSTVCRWRSCLSEACQESGHKYLCSYHHHLKRYLDEEYTNQGTSKTGNPSTLKESSKYLPKKVNYSNLISIATSATGTGTIAGQQQQGRGRTYNLDTQIDRDLLMITASCTLIHELWDGKLQLTLNTFLQKICLELNSRKRILQTLSSLPSSSSSPSSFSHTEEKKLFLLSSSEWSQWKNEHDYHRTLHSRHTSLQLLQQILQIEKEITNEFFLLNKMKIFPSAEIIMIKKETKAYRERWCVENTPPVGTGGAGGGGTGGGGGGDPFEEILDPNVLENELILSERKLSIIRGRRVDEEETRMVQKKRMVKAKQIEETQSKDPLNFRNQTRF